MFAAVRFVRDHAPDGLDPVARHVALTIASFADRNGSAELGVRAIAHSSGLHPTTIVKAIRRLESAGMLSVTRRSDRRSSYLFPVQDLSTTVLPGRAVASAKPRVLGARTARRGSTRWTSLGENEDARGRFIPGTGWVPAYQGAANQ